MSQTATDTKVKTKLKQPSMKKVVMLNDNYTPMDFVVWVLTEIYGRSRDESQEIMMHIHKNGRGVAGIFTQEIAEQKKYETDMMSEQYGHPLKVVVEPA